MQTKQLEQALPEILEKALKGKRNVVVKANDAAQVEQLNTLLWTYRANSFLPHGTDKDGHEKEQPIWLTTKDENPNNADVLILAGGATTENLDAFSLCCEMLDGRDDSAVQIARQKWKSYKEAGFDMTYWKQSQTGAWESK